MNICLILENLIFCCRSWICVPSPQSIKKRCSLTSKTWKWWVFSVGVAEWQPKILSLWQVPKSLEFVYLQVILCLDKCRTMFNDSVLIIGIESFNTITRQNPALIIFWLIWLSEKKYALSMVSKDDKSRIKSELNLRGKKSISNDRSVFSNFMYWCESLFFEVMWTKYWVWLQVSNYRILVATPFSTWSKRFIFGICIRLFSHPINRSWV